MKLNDLKEQEEQYGVVVGLNHDGTFYDIHYVDYNTHRLIDIDKSFIEDIRENNTWDEVFPFFEKIRQGKKLGDDFSAEDANFYLFGPFSGREMSMLSEKFNHYLERKYGSKGEW